MAVQWLWKGLKTDTIVSNVPSIRGMIPSETLITIACVSLNVEIMSTFSFHGS